MNELRFARSICGLLAVFSFAFSQETVSYRLPLEVVPSSYSIQLIPYLDEGDSSRQFTFDGNVSILVQAQRPEKTITLHAKDITLHTVTTVTEIDSGFSQVANVTWDSVRDFLILNLEETLNEGSFYLIYIEYTGILNDDLVGFYRSSYTQNGTTRWLATTQFEPTHARLAFPCFDEPALKATFNISIARLPEVNAISNMPLKATFGPDITLNGRYWDTFETTVKMSTYLVAFVVSDFQNLHNGTYRVWSKPPTVQNGQFALEVSPRIMKMLENITKIPYQLPKMDLIAVPDYGSGAMENWGLVTYMESFLLLPTDPTDTDYDNVAGVTAHEFAHQWFGNMVSPNWWKYTWLNEGFANFFEYYVMDEMYPEFDDYNQQVQRQFDYMTYYESDSETVTMDVQTPAEIENMFGLISYYKGGAILKMVQNALTTDTFFKGLNRYLLARAYSDAVPDDVSAGLQEAVDEDKNLEAGIKIKEFMDSWTLQGGYPVVTVTRNYSAGTATLKQEYFATDDSQSNNQWYIPITYTTSEELDFNDTKPDLWLIPNSTRDIQNLPGEDQWIILNKKGTGYFRVNYDQQNWKLLIAQLNGDNYESIHELNRIQLQSDSRLFYDAGLLDADATMNVIKSLERETSPAVWSVGLRGLESLYEKLGGSSYFPALQSFYLRLMKRFYEKVSIASRSEENKIVSRIRPDFVRWACFLGNEDCLKSSSRILTSTRASSEDHRSYEKLRPSMYCAAVRNNGESSWNWLWDVYQNTEDVKERQQALQALGCTNDSKLLKRLLDLTINGNSGLKPQDRINAFSAVCNGRDEAACDLVLKFLTPRVKLLADLFGEYESVATVLHRVASKLRTQEQVHRLKHIIMKNMENLPDYINTDSVKMAQENVQWLKGKGAEIGEWLLKHNSAP